MWAPAAKLGTKSSFITKLPTFEVMVWPYPAHLCLARSSSLVHLVLASAPGCLDGRRFGIVSICQRSKTRDSCEFKDKRTPGFGGPSTPFSSTQLSYSVSQNMLRLRPPDFWWSFRPLGSQSSAHHSAPSAQSLAPASQLPPGTTARSSWTSPGANTEDIYIYIWICLGYRKVFYTAVFSVFKHDGAKEKHHDVFRLVLLLGAACPRHLFSENWARKGWYKVCDQRARITSHRARHAGHFKALQGTLDNWQCLIGVVTPCYTYPRDTKVTHKCGISTDSPSEFSQQRPSLPAFLSEYLGKLGPWSFSRSLVTPHFGRTFCGKYAELSHQQHRWLGLAHWFAAAGH